MAKKAPITVELNPDELHEARRLLVNARKEQQRTKESLGICYTLPNMNPVAVRLRSCIMRMLFEQTGSPATFDTYVLWKKDRWPSVKGVTAMRIKFLSDWIEILDKELAKP